MGETQRRAGGHSSDAFVVYQSHVERFHLNTLSCPTSAYVQADVRIGAPAGGSPRGVLAERNFLPQEVILSIPSHLTVRFEGTPEEACVLLLHIKHDMEKQQQYRPWLATLPGPEDFVPWDQLDDEALSLLQSPEMVCSLLERA